MSFSGVSVFQSKSQVEVEQWWLLFSRSRTMMDFSRIEVEMEKCLGQLFVFQSDRKQSL